MTAVKSVEIVTRVARHTAERKQWKQEAADYLVQLGIFGPDETEQAWDYADRLCYHSRDEGGELFMSAKEAVDEDVAYVPS